MNDWGDKVTFTDKRGREIEITINECGEPAIEARCNNNLIGRFEFEQYLSSIILAHASINSDFQNAGIGSRMLKEFNELCDDWLVPNTRWCQSTGHQFYLSGEGAALLNSCKKNGTIDNSREASY